MFESIPTYINQILHFLDKTKWKAEDYVAALTKRATGQNLQVEAKLLKKYPPIFSPIRYQMEPCTTLDEDGNIMMWYIPGALIEQRAVSPFPVLLSGPEVDWL